MNIKNKILKYKLDNSSLFVDRVQYSTIFAKYEIFKKILNNPGSIIECGVREGNGLMLFAKLSAIFEPYNFKRKINVVLNKARSWSSHFRKPLIHNNWIN